MKRTHSRSRGDGDEREGRTEDKFSVLRLNTRIKTGDASARAPIAIADVVRDGDNATLVADVDFMATFVARELDDADEAAVKRALEHVLILMPSLQTRGGLKSIGVKTLASFVRDIKGVTARLNALRRTFPTCDVAELATKAPFVMRDSIEDMERNLDELRVLFPNAGRDGKPDVDRMVQRVPQLLDARFASAALDALCASAGYASRAEAAEAVHRSPSLALAVESASLRSAYSVNFDQTHVKRNKVVANDAEPYYDSNAIVRRDPELPYW